MNKTIILTARLIVGIVFIFSGTVKAIDPMGSVYKFQDYFTAFNIQFLDPLSLPLALLLCLTEFLAGFALISGVRIRTGIWISFIMMLFFTPLTLVLAISNPVSDCGCFGDAVHLTNWQTFLKNLVLLAFVLLLLFNRKISGSHYPVKKEWVITGAAAVLFLLFSWYNLRYLPVIDFLPYSEGTYIPDKMKVPDGVPVDTYESVFIYEKDGTTKEFTLENYPANDTAWKFVDTRTTLVKRGYTPEIHDFSIKTTGNEDLTESILVSDNYTLLMIVKRISETDPKRLREASNISAFCRQNGIDFYILTASSTGEINAFSNGLTVCQTDETTLKTMVRSDPGYMLLKKGTIIKKWSRAGLPGKEWFLELIENDRKTK
jgi:uncharacterized membrane protein YphA (DoxX/SURF4 family)